MKIALIGEYNPKAPSHVATEEAIMHSNHALNSAIQSEWVSTETIDETLFDTYQGIWVAPGSPYKNMEKTLWAIQYARENRIPCLGTCGGFQHIILEYARNILGYKDAAHAEYDPYASDLFITSLPCSLKGRQMRLNFKPNSKIATIYGTESERENYYCDFGLNPKFLPLFRNQPLKITGSDSEGEMRVVELENHPFFIGTLFVPQNQSTKETPHPIVIAFLKAILSKNKLT